MASLLFTLYLHTYAKVDICAHPGILYKLHFLLDILDFSSQRIIPSPASRNYTSAPQWPTMVWEPIIDEVALMRSLSSAADTRSAPAAPSAERNAAGWARVISPAIGAGILAEVFTY